MAKLSSDIYSLARLFRFFLRVRPPGWSARPAETQRKIFDRVLRMHYHTAFGRDYDLTNVRTYDEFAARVPIFTYETLFPYIDRMYKGEEKVLTTSHVGTYAKSSGTTNGRSKYIPTPRAYVKGNHLRAGRDIIAAYMRAHPTSKIFFGKSIVVSGNVAPILGTEKEEGDISALIVNSLPWWASFSRAYSKAVSLIPTWPERARAIARASAGSRVVSLFGAPTWMLEILEIARSQSGVSTIRELWPGLEVFFHGAVSFLPYEKSYEKIIGEPGIEYREVYNATEGMFAFEDDPVGHPGEMLLCTDHHVFYEFIPYDGCDTVGDPVTIEQIEAGKSYALVISTTSGLVRYTIGDVVSVMNTVPVRIKIQGRTTQFMNAFGEEVVADNAVRAIEEAARIAEAHVQSFTAAPTFDAAPAQGAHEWIVEFRAAPADEARFVEALDTALRELNSDYHAKREGDILLGPPIVRIVPPGTFRKYLEQKGRLGGQHKVPLLSVDRTVVEAVCALIG